MNIQLTLDFELFLGDNTGSVQKCLIEPMDALDAVLKKKGVRLTLFVDGSYLLKMRSLQGNKKMAEDYRTVCDYLEKLSAEGHELQFHFHPQWLYSSFTESGWQMDLDHYKLSDMEEAYLQSSFSDAMSILRSISHNEVNAFRAGGYSIQTYPHIKELFLANGIRIDSSVMPGAVILEEKHYYDFRKTPAGSCWKFSDDVIKSDPAGCFVEMPITTYVPLTNIRYLLKKRRLARNHAGEKIWGDGRSIDLAGSTARRLLDQASKFFRPCVFVASIDNVMSENLDHMYHNNNGDFFTVIGHPKNFTRKSIANVAAFIDKVAGGDVFSTVSECL